MFAAPGKPRTPYDALVSVLQPMDPAELRFRADQLARVFTDRGVTYDFAGEECPFPLDLFSVRAAGGSSHSKVTPASSSPSPSA